MAAQLNLALANSAGNTYDLAALGSADWFVLPGAWPQVEKSGASELVLSLIAGTNNPSGFTGTDTTLTWTGGAPTASGSTNGGGYTAISAQGKGFSITVPAGTATRTLRLFLGTFQTAARVAAVLSDGSAAGVSDSSLVHTGSGNASMGIATITYAAGSDGQTLAVTITNDTAAGNINMQGAALTTAASGGGAVKPSAPTDVIATAGANSVSVTATPGASGSAAVSRFDVNVYAVDDNALLGTNYGASLPITVSGIPAEAVRAKVTATSADGTSDESAASNQVTPTSAPQPVQVAITDPNLAWSPYNWDDYGTHKSANNCGAYVKLGFTGTSIAVKLDVAHMVAASLPAGQYPIVRTIIDGSAFVDTQLTSSTATLSRAGLADAAHTLEVVFLAAHTISPDRWNTPVSAVRVSGFTLDAGKATAPHATRGKKLLFYGDSITEGYWSLGTTTSIPAGNSSLHTAVPSIAQALSAEYGQVGFGAQGYAVAGQGNVPNLNSAWNLYSAGRSRLVGGKLSPEPDYICVEHGANGSTSQANVQTTITNLRAAAPNARIFMLVPGGGFARSAITAAVAANSSDAKLHLIDLGGEYEKGINNSGGNNMYALDALHRNVLSNARVAAGFSQKMQAAIDGATVVQPTLNPRTVTVTLEGASGLAANLTGLKVCFHDEASPAQFTVPRYQSANAGTNASGVLTFVAQSTLASGGTGHLTVLGADNVHYNGPVQVT